jgi:hypothetical protein
MGTGARPDIELITAEKPDVGRFLDLFRKIGTAIHLK